MAVTDLDRVDPAYHPALRALARLNPAPLSAEALPALRATRLAAMRARHHDVPGVEALDLAIAGLEARLYRPAAAGPLPALLWLHGGGLVMGTFLQDDLRLRTLAADAGVAVLAIDYRLAPEHPYPAALDDAFAALGWLAGEGPVDGLDPARLAVGGASAGGGLAAALALRARATGGPALAFQLLLYPMLDDTNVEPAGEGRPDHLGWTRAANAFAWKAYLGDRPEVPPTAAPARARDLAGLPPAYLAVGALDIYDAETRAYAARLAAAGVPTDLRTYPAVFHGFDALAPEAPCSRRFVADYAAALRARLGRSASP